MLRRALLVSLLLAGYGVSAVADSDRPVFGWLEMASIEPIGVVVKAKLDSGALTSSMHAQDIEEFEKDGEEWVRFTLGVEDEYSDKEVAKTLEMPLYRDLKLRGAGGVDKRPVVLMRICLRDTIYEEQFSLRNREKMNYPVLLGRRTIQSLGLLDVRETFLQKPDCGEDTEVMAYEEKKYSDAIGAK